MCDCGYDFSRGAPPSALKAVDRIAGNRARSARLLSRLGLAAGLLAVLPYVLLRFVWPHGIHTLWLQPLFGLSLLLGFFFGAFFGLAGLILAILGGTLSFRASTNLVFSIPAALLGLAGILGNIWFFATCQFCQ